MKKDTFLILSSGEYSDYSVLTPMQVLKDFDFDTEHHEWLIKKGVSEEDLINLDEDEIADKYFMVIRISEYKPNLVEHLINKGFIKDVEKLFTHIHLAR